MYLNILIYCKKKVDFSVDIKAKFLFIASWVNDSENWLMKGLSIIFFFGIVSEDRSVPSFSSTSSTALRTFKAVVLSYFWLTWPIQDSWWHFICWTMSMASYCVVLLTNAQNTINLPQNHSLENSDPLDFAVVQIVPRTIKQNGNY